MKRTLRATLIIGATAFLVLTSVSTVTPDPAGWALPAKFRGGTIESLDAQAIRADLEDGSIVLTLQGVAYGLTVAPVPWDPNVRAASPDGAGGWTYGPYTNNVAYLGTVDGQETSLVLIGVTTSGVDGFIMIPDREALFFEPLTFFDRNAPEDLVVVYHPSDLVVAPDLTDIEDVDPNVVPSEAPPRVLGASPGPDRNLMLWVDEDFWFLFGDPVGKAAAVYNQMNTFYNLNMGFNFNLVDNSIFFCDTAACEAEWGMTSTAAATLRNEWATQVSTDCSCPAYELAHLLSGKDFDGGTIGIAYLPGRYAISQIRDAAGSTYQGGSSSYEGGLLMSHEVGHNFNGRHQNDGGLIDRTGARTYTHNHPFNHCHLLVPILNLCLQNHVHDDFWDHFTIMWTPFLHHPEQKDEMIGDFSNDNFNWMRDCNNFDWAEGTFAAQTNPGMGFWCNDT